MFRQMPTNSTMSSVLEGSASAVGQNPVPPAGHDRREDHVLELKKITYWR
ncbi:hypothetical protein HRW23_17685 [Streptomyces lunaelactis]|nr:hypothetical protein [Streptomyces lunaelactis]NUK03730.1 hypothetical protein [Streptomyces lunaelactis]NUK36677.1 hypothetical protein [Streptomyces lunaelactis]NUK43728.1 hypothetical protein [Streptomyces lunaelactis]NUK79199.1 hypothetical protein [Streptomyces lunaelactis]